MNDTDKTRLARALKDALEHIERETFCYCLLDEPEHLKIKRFCEVKIRELKE